MREQGHHRGRSLTVGAGDREQPANLGAVKPGRPRVAGDLWPALLEHPTQAMYGLEISHGAGLATGTIHPILARLEGAGWLLSSWEDIDPHKEGRPRRRYYRLSPDGIEQARYALANAHTPVSRMPGLRPGLAGGTI